MYSEINPPPPLPCMTKTNYHNSWYYSVDKIAMIDRRELRADAHRDRQQGGTRRHPKRGQIDQTQEVSDKHTRHTMPNSLSDMFHQLDDVDMDAFIDDMMRDDYDNYRGYCSRASVSDDSIDWIIANDINV